MVTALEGSSFPVMVGDIMAKQGTGSVTKRYTFMSMKEDYGVLRDTFGMDPENYLHDEVSLMLEGKLPQGWKLGKPALSGSPKVRSTATLADAVHVVAIVAGADELPDEATARKHFQPFKRFLDGARDRGEFLSLLF